MVSWLFSIMVSIWKNDLRSKATETRVLSVIREIPEVNSENQKILGKIFLSEVLTAMKQLNPDQAAAITLTSLEGHSYRQAAEILGIPQGTLESRIARGRIALGRILEGQTTNEKRLQSRSGKAS